MVLEEDAGSLLYSEKSRSVRNEPVRREIGLSRPPESPSCRISDMWQGDALKRATVDGGSVEGTRPMGAPRKWWPTGMEWAKLSGVQDAGTRLSQLEEQILELVHGDRGIDPSVHILRR